jgi:thiamine biosynthesis lipoprotein
MATWFEALLVGDDEEHLTAVGESALDEVARIERLLSRHDPASETSRINREAAFRPVRVDREMFAILRKGMWWSEETGGYFDLCAGSGVCSLEALWLDEDARTVWFLDPSARLDFGGFGKGYAIDAACRLLDEFGIGSGLLHGGTSSVRARGRPEDAPAWRAAIRDPFRASGSEITFVDLVDCGLSSSAAFHPGSAVSDLLDPITSRALEREVACSVIAPTATEAEVWSTALLAMGKSRAAGWPGRGVSPGRRALWIEKDGGRIEAGWLDGGGDSS